ncbi:Protein of unknown function [Gryllus bimaculatus]|nr:Protein of unknown function [Gryllus bimaculatus]
MEAVQRELLSLTSESDISIHPESSLTSFNTNEEDNSTSTEEIKNQCLFQQSKHSENEDISDDGRKVEIENTKTKDTTEGHSKEDMYYQIPKEVKILPSQVDPLAFGDVWAVDQSTDEQDLNESFGPDCFQMITYRVPKFPIIFCVVIIISTVLFISIALFRKGRSGR